MTTTGLEALDTSVQKTNEWLLDIAHDLGVPDRQHAWRALHAVLHALRDRLSIDLSSSLSAQLPLIIRGVYFEGWQPAKVPELMRTRDEFLARVEQELVYPLAGRAADAARVVLEVLVRRTTPGESEKIRHSLPEAIRELMPQHQAVAFAQHGSTSVPPS